MSPENAWWPHVCEETAPCGRKSAVSPTACVRGYITLSRWNIISFCVTTVPDCTKNQTAQSDTQHVLSDFEHNQGHHTVLLVSFYFC